MDKDDDIKHVRELLNAYGANRARWPEGSATRASHPESIWAKRRCISKRLWLSINF
jgi:hypothetical protein